MREAVWNYSDHYFCVHILVDGVYEGIGRFCETWEEAVAYAEYHNCEILRRAMI